MRMAIARLTASILLTLPFSSTFISQEKMQEFESAIEDNSFFVEEAFNQEERVVQHITNATYFTNPEHDFFLTFTQEWPLFSQHHQLSYTVPYSAFNSATTAGFGDVLLNYRYQLMTSDQWAAIAPRVSLILPTGDADIGLGNGVVGVQFNLPVSKRFSNPIIGHVNAGMTILPDVKGIGVSGNEMKKTLTSYTIAASVIWLTATNYNFMLEVSENFFEEFDGSGINETVINPGFRCAFNEGDLQIVPGIGVPVMLQQEQTHMGILLYLSFEHPF